MNPSNQHEQPLSPSDEELRQKQTVGRTVNPCDQNEPHPLLLELRQKKNPEVSPQREPLQQNSNLREHLILRQSVLPKENDSTQSASQQTYKLCNEHMVIISERMSSLFAPEIKGQILRLSKSSIGLQRKASALSNTSQDSMMIIDAEINLTKNDSNLYHAMFRGMKQSWDTGLLTGDEFKAEGKAVWKKRAKLNREAKMLEEKRNSMCMKRGEEFQSTLDAYSNAHIRYFANFSGPPISERRNHHDQEAWKKGLRDYYGSLEEPGRGEHQGKLWCPILKGYYPFKSMCAAHIIPHSQGYSDVAYTLGDEGNPGKGAAHIWSFRNGLIMNKVLEKKFDNADFVIVPLPNGPHVPARLRLVLLNTAYSHHRVGDHGPRYSELDGRELEFKTEARPGYRYLYWHYVTSLMRAVKWEKATLESIKAKLPNAPIWSTPGAYLRKSMLKRLGQSIGDYDVNDRDFEEGLFGGVGEKSTEEEVAIAAKAAEAFELTSSGEDDEDDEDDEYDEYDEYDEDGD